MTTQETENQAGGAEPSTEAETTPPAGNDAAGVDAGAESASSGSTDTPAEGAGSPASSSEAGEPAPDAGQPAEAPTGEPQPDSVSPRQKLHDDTVKLIVACRREGVDIIEFVKAKIDEIAD